MILDEFPYLCEAAPKPPSIIQRFWDLEGQHGRLFWCFAALNWASWSERSWENVLRSMGGVPGNCACNPWIFARPAGSCPATGRASVCWPTECSGACQSAAFCAGAVTSRKGYLYEEPRFLLRLELRDVRVLGAIASGCTRLNEITQRVGVPVHTASKYLSVLQELALIIREVPFTARAPQRSKRGRYWIVDPFLRFWYRFVYPHATLIEAGQGWLVYERFIASQLAPTWGRFLWSAMRPTSWVCLR